MSRKQNATRTRPASATQPSVTLPACLTFLFTTTTMPEPTVSIPVPSEDPKKKEEKPNAKADGKLKDDEKEGEDLVGVYNHTWLLNPSAYVACPQSEEDLQLKNELEMLVERLKVRTAYAYDLHGLKSRVGTKRRSLPTRSRNTSDTD